MTKALILLLTLIFLAGCSSAPKPESNTAPKPNKYDFKELTLISLLPFFENGTMKKGEILWKPTGEEQEKLEDQLSEDGHLHTILDTVLQHGDKYYMIIHTIQYMYGDLQDCHPCAPITGIASFKKTETGFHLLNFNKFVFHAGSYGLADKIVFDKLFEDVMHVSGGWTGGGSDLTHESFYDLENFGLIFEYTSYESNLGFYDEGEANYEIMESKITHKAESSFVLETTIEKYDSLSVKSEEKYMERITKTEFGISRKRI